MKIITIAVTNTPEYKGAVELKKSLIKYNISNEIIVTPWEGFFTKIDQAYKFCQQTDADFVLFVDCHDVIFVGGLDGIIEMIIRHPDADCIFSTEKAIWPVPEVWEDPSLSDKYPPSESPWRYLNSGTYLFRPQRLVEVVEKNMPKIGVDDQYYWAQHFLNDNMNCVLDTNCEIFQTLAHDDGSSFSVIDGKFTNVVTNTNPVVIHGNGQYPMDKFYGL